MFAFVLQLALAVPFAPVPVQPTAGDWIRNATWLQANDYADDAGVPLGTLIVQLRRNPGPWTEENTIDAGPHDGVATWVAFEEDDAGWCWRAKYVNTRDEESAWGPEGCFDIDTTAPPKPLGFDAGPASSIGTVAVTALPVVDARSATDGYFLLVARDPAGPWFSQRGVQHPGLPFTALLGPGSWYLGVEAVDLAGNTSSAEGEPLAWRAITVAAADSSSPTPPAPTWEHDYTKDWGDQLGYDVGWAVDAGVSHLALSIREADGGEWHHVGLSATDPRWPWQWIETFNIRRDGVFVARAAALVNGRTSRWSAESLPVVVDATEPQEPAGPTLTPLETRADPLQLRWTAASDNLAGVDVYKVHLHNASSGADVYLMTPGTALDAGTLDEGRWSFQVRARDRADNWSPYTGSSPTALVDRTGPVASAPQVEAGDGGVVVRWMAPVDALSSLASIELVRDEAGGGQQALPATASPFADDPPRGTWTWRVRGTDRLGNRGAFSAPSAAVVITATGGVVVGPRITSVLPGVLGCGAFTTSLSASGDAPLAWSLVSGPPGATLEATSGVLAWTVDGVGPAELTVAVTNPAGTDQRTFVVERTCAAPRGPWDFRVGCEAGPGGLLVALALVLRRRRPPVVR